MLASGVGGGHTPLTIPPLSLPKPIMSRKRATGIRKVALLDFDVHHGNGTEAVVANTVPSLKKV